MPRLLGMTSAPAPPPPGRPETQSPGPPGWLLRVIRDQRVAFLVVGGVNTLTGIAAFVGFELLVSRFAPGLAAVAHNTLVLGLAHVVTVLIAFVLYRTLVFRVHGHVWRDLARFESVYLSSLGVNWVLLNLLTLWAGLPTIPAQAIVLVLQMFWSWFGHKHFSFRRPRPEAP